MTVVELSKPFNKVSYEASQESLDSNKPTVICLHTVATNRLLYHTQLNDEKLKSAANLISVDLIGHGQTQTDFDIKGWTYWDNASLVLALMDKLGIDKAYIIGTSQGGFVSTRVALKAPDRVLGIGIWGSSIFAETPDTVANGCWDPHTTLKEPLENFSGPPSDDFIVPDEFVQLLLISGYGTGDILPEKAEVWTPRLKTTYKGSDGYNKLGGILRSLVGRASVHDRASEITCPVLLLHGDEDIVYSVKIAEIARDLFTNADVTFKVIEGGSHFLCDSTSEEVNQLLHDFIV